MKFTQIQYDLKDRILLITLNRPEKLWTLGGAIFLAAILVIFAALATTYSVIVPPFEASDELWHYPMVKAIADHWALPVQDPAESIGARIRAYHAFTERAYGIRPAPESVRVTRLLAILEEGSSAVALDRSLRATFAREQERCAAASPEARTSGTNGVPQLPAASLKIGRSSRGPALIVLPGASAFVPEGTAYHVDGWGNLVLETG